MSALGLILSAVAVLVAIISASIAYRAYKLTQHYRDPIWVLRVDRQVPPGWDITKEWENAQPGMQLRLENHGTDTVKQVTVRAIFDPTDIKGFAAKWPLIEAGEFRRWQVTGLPLSKDYQYERQAVDSFTQAEGRRVLRVEWKGPQRRRRREDIPIPTLEDTIDRLRWQADPDEPTR
ncbi:hypothetical protein [Curtobacterium sp. HSID17257]|uniref:hypothetical protein n=1 Tax=Curtobacterium sp. HSID17257 TaxID=2419510 RepID=UPI000F88D170|nr:hypothetical protein [Curtobacterium sp. HSID17257]RUQ09121.1 hypothetical protein D8M35_03220 [Curtobacterium sp. HSID17257]